MPLFLSPIISGLIGITLAVFGGFIGTPGTAIAPTDIVPTLMQKAAASLKIPLKTGMTTSASKPAPKKTPANNSSTTASKEEPKIQHGLNAIAEALVPTTTPLYSSSVTDAVRAAVVNIVCTSKTASSVNSISGSGVIIDSRGIIMTNSHVAQYFLLQDYPSPGSVNCIIRTGSPATPSYTAELLYFPSAWMEKNASKINDPHPTGNGEYDYAFLRITGTVSPNVTLPSAFPFLAIATDLPEETAQVLVAAYPAGFLGGLTIATELYAASAESEVGNLYSFEGTSIDLFSVGGTIVSQPGSSGGAVTDGRGTLVGLIVTASDAPDTASRDLRAIATPYIINDFEHETGTPLKTFLEGDAAAEAKSFATGSKPRLAAELESALQK